MLTASFRLAFGSRWSNSNTTILDSSAVHACVRHQVVPDNRSISVLSPRIARPRLQMETAARTAKHPESTDASAVRFNRAAQRAREPARSDDADAARCRHLLVRGDVRRRRARGNPARLHRPPFRPVSRRRIRRRRPYSVAFGLGHLEQGWDAAIATGVLGAVWGCLYWSAAASSRQWSAMPASTCCS